VLGQLELVAAGRGGGVLERLGRRESAATAAPPRLVRQKRPGNTVTLELVRGGKRENVDVRLSDKPQ
jgi:S1-C subfamily serine protease